MSVQKMTRRLKTQKRNIIIPFMHSGPYASRLAMPVATVHSFDLDVVVFYPTQPHASSFTPSASLLFHINLICTHISNGKQLMILGFFFQQNDIFVCLFSYNVSV